MDFDTSNDKNKQMLAIFLLKYFLNEWSTYLFFIRINLVSSNIAELSVAAWIRKLEFP